MQPLKRILGAAALLILGITDIAPHRHGDSLDLWLGDDVAPQSTSIVRCDGPAAGATHLHGDTSRQVEACLACLRQHMQATSPVWKSSAPVLRRHVLVITACVAYARAIPLRRLSRAPPQLPS